MTEKLSRLSLWLESSKRQQAEFEALAASKETTELLRASIRVSGSTSRINLLCKKGHPTGLVARLGLVDDKAVVRLSSMPNSVKPELLTLRGWENGPSVVMTCAVCGSKHRTSLARVLQGSLLALKAGRTGFRMN